MALEDLLNRYYYPLVQQQIYGSPEGSGVRAMTAGGAGGDAEQGDGGVGSVSIPDFRGGGGVGAPSPGAAPITPGIGPTPMGPGPSPSGGFVGDPTSSSGDMRGVSGQYGNPIGRSGWLEDFAAFAPFPLNLLAAGANAVGGALSADAAIDGLEEVTGNPNLEPTFGDYVSAATGFNLSPRARGVGGYGDIGALGTTTGRIDYYDPGVAGPARAMGRAQAGGASVERAPGRGGFDIAGMAGSAPVDYAAPGAFGNRGGFSFGGLSSAGVGANTSYGGGSGGRQSSSAGDGGRGDTGRGGADRGSLGRDRDTNYGGPR